MQRIEDELTQPADNLALDEAMLVQSEEGGITEAIRIWAFREPVVVAGRATRIDDEIDSSFCRSQAIPIFRRCSGGAAVVGGPGCVMYTVILSLDNEPGLRKIDAAHEYVMSRVLRAFQKQVADATLSGTCDLTLQNRKCSGNSMRIARRHLLYHGTLLHDFDIPLIGRCLKEAPRQPEYRQGRDHDAFLTNVSLDAVQFGNDLCEVFGARGSLRADTFAKRIRLLREQRYDLESWNFRH